MAMNALLNNLLAVDNPLLPGPVVARFALQVIWAIVLGSGAGWLAHRLSRTYRLGLVVLVMVWTLVPGSASPAYWLGLAFQAPSLMSGVICLAGLFNSLRQKPERRTEMTANEARTLHVLTMSGVVLGWVLLLDTLAWLPVSVYAWGFSSVAFLAVTLVVTLLWVLSGGKGAHHRGRMSASVMVLGVLTLFVLTRLPTGNVWDALLDPWLWAALQAWWFFKAVRWVKAAWHRSPPIRA